MRCRALRELGALVANGKTYESIAQAAGVDRVAVVHWFSERCRPRLAQRIMLRKRLGIRVIWWQSDEWIARALRISSEETAEELVATMQ